MLIVTQKKDRIINLRNVEDVFVATNCSNAIIETRIYAGVVSGTKMMLGKYKDEARARKVLEEIARECSLGSGRAVYEMPEE